MSSDGTTGSYIDPRGARFAASVTAVVLALVVLTGSGLLLALQTLVFAAGAIFGVRRSPYSTFFRFVKDVARIGPPAELEAEAPVRFAQAVGLAFGVAGTTGFAAGSTAVGTTAAAIAFAAAFLNAAFGFCLGCEIYLIARRVLGRGAFTRFVPARTTVEGSSS
jgi:hypothetical protein